MEVVENIGIDEKSFTDGHKYVTTLGRFLFLRHLRFRLLFNFFQ